MITSQKTQSGESYVIVQESKDSDMRATSGRWNDAAGALQYLRDNPAQFAADGMCEPYVERQVITIVTTIEHERVSFVEVPK